jgi:cell division protein ZapA
MNDKETSTASVELLGKFYSIRCPASEMQSLQQAADYLNLKMAEVKESGKTINFEHIAVITALNLAHQLLELEQQKNNLMERITQHINHLQDKLDTAVPKVSQTELIYISE